MPAWVVLLEAVSPEDGPPVEQDVLSDVVVALGAHPTALYSGHRCAITVEVCASDQAQAVYEVLCRWERAFRARGTAEWSLLRIEVLTPEEFQLDLGDDDAASALAAVQVDEGSATDADSVVSEVLDHVFRDPLTGLANVDTFHRRVTQVVRLGGTRFAVIRLGLDGFRAINQRMGDAAGDRVLSEVATRVAGALRPNDVVARIGGDEFAVLLNGCVEQSAVRVSMRLLGAIRTPIEVRGQEVAVSASAGIAAIDSPPLGRDVLACAEDALADAKAAGGDAYAVFRNSSNQTQR